METPGILILALSNLRHDARVARQISFLKDRYRVTVVCFGADDQSGYEKIVISPPLLTLRKKLASSILLLTGQYRTAHRLLYPYSSIGSALQGRTFDLVIANDVETLPIAFGLFPKTKVMFDAHEYAPRHFEDRWVWRVFFQRFTVHLCRTHIPNLAAMTTVCQGLAEEYEKNFGTKPVVLTNASRFHELAPSPTPVDRVRMIHHGGANPSRRLEWMIDAVDLLDERFTLDLMLISPPMANRKTRGYLERLKQRVRNHPRVRILDPVRSEDVVNAIHQYDVGLFLIPPINFNYANTLPNKLFDFIQARLAIAIGPTPEMARLVRKYDLGIMSDDFTAQSLSAALSALSAERIQYFKVQSAKAAAVENADANQSLLLTIVSEVLSKG